MTTPIGSGLRSHTGRCEAQTGSSLETAGGFSMPTHASCPAQRGSPNGCPTGISRSMTSSKNERNRLSLTFGKKPTLKLGFPICPPRMAPLYTQRQRSARNPCSSQHRPASEAVSSARAPVRPLKSLRSGRSADTAPDVLSVRSPGGRAARAARQPAGTGSAQIRRSMSPNSRLVRCPSASRSQ